MPLSYDRAHAVVTGAGSGIGRALVLDLLERGSRVVATDIGPDSLAALTDAAGEYRERLRVIPADVSLEEEVREVKSLADRFLGHVDLLCNNAGVAFNSAPTYRTPHSAVEWSYGVNVFGVLHGIRAFVPDMIDRGSGHVVNTSSIGGFQVSGRTDIWFQGVYASTKYAVVAISEALAMELEPHGIGVSVLAPSAVSTGIATSGALRPQRFGGALDDASPTAMGQMLAQEGMSPEAVARLTLAGVQAGRFYLFTDTTLRERIRDRARRIDEGFDALETVEGRN